MSGTSVDPTVLSVILGIAAAVVAISALVKWHKALLGAVGRGFKTLFTFNGFFWIVNLSCMAYSAQNAGYIFGLYETSGFVIGLALDGLIIVFTQTALAAKARGEAKRAGLILLFIVACCLLSTIGNLAHNLHTDISAQTSGVWFQELVPYITSLMPLLLIAMAWVADLKIDPMEKEDPEVYQTNEKKRFRFHLIQIESHERREALQTRAIAVEMLRRRNSALRRGKTPGSFRWFWEKAVDAGEIIAGVSGQLKALFDPQIAEMKRELEALRKEKLELAASIERMNAEKMTEFQQSCRTFIAQLIEGIRVDLAEQNERYRLALGEQYGQDIMAVKGQLTLQINDALSELKTTISHDVEALSEAFDLTINAKQTTAKSSTVIELTSEQEIVVKRYPIVESWLTAGRRSITLQDIIDATNHSSQLIHRRAKAGAFRATKREGYYRIDSVITWLRTAPLPRLKEQVMVEDKGEQISPITVSNELPNTDQIEVISPENGMENPEVMSGENGLEDGSNPGEIGEEMESESSTSAEKSPDKLAMTVAAMRVNPQITDEELAEILGLKRPASARFWKVKVQVMWEQEQQQETSPSLEYATV